METIPYFWESFMTSGNIANFQESFMTSRNHSQFLRILWPLKADPPQPKMDPLIGNISNLNSVESYHFGYQSWNPWFYSIYFTVSMCKLVPFSNVEKNKWIKFQHWKNISYGIRPSHQKNLSENTKNKFGSIACYPTPF